MFLCRRWWISCRTLSSSFVCSHLIQSRLSKYPRSCLSMSPCARLCASRSWQNSWWKCRRSFPIPRCSGLWSSTSTFQFLVVKGDSQVHKVFFPDRVQQRRPSCRSLTFRVEVFKVLALDRVRQRLRLFTLQLVRMMTRMSLVKGFFALFPALKKCEVGFALGVGTASRVEPIHASCSAGGLRRVGAAQGTPRWQDLLLEQTY